MGFNELFVKDIDSVLLASFKKIIDNANKNNNYQAEYNALYKMHEEALDNELSKSVDEQLIKYQPFFKEDLDTLKGFLEGKELPKYFGANQIFYLLKMIEASATISVLNNRKISTYDLNLDSYDGRSIRYTLEGFLKKPEKEGIDFLLKNEREQKIGDIDHYVTKFKEKLIPRHQDFNDLNDKYASFGKKFVLDVNSLCIKKGLLIDLPFLVESVRLSNDITFNEYNRDDYGKWKLITEHFQGTLMQVEQGDLKRDEQPKVKELVLPKLYAPISKGTVIIATLDLSFNLPDLIDLSYAAPYQFKVDKDSFKYSYIKRELRNQEPVSKVYLPEQQITYEV